METVVKVSGNRKVDKPSADAANATLAAGSGDATTKTVKDGMANTDGTNTTSKPKPKIDTTVEKEVDRIIDSQDNEYVLSKPKYDVDGGGWHHTLCVYGHPLCVRCVPYMIETHV